MPHHHTPAAGHVGRESGAVASPSPSRASKSASRKAGSSRASAEPSHGDGGAVSTRITADAFPESRRQPGEANSGGDGDVDLGQLEFVRVFAEQSAPRIASEQNVSPPPVASPSVQGLKFFQQLNQDIAASDSSGGDGHAYGQAAGPVGHLAFFKALHEDTAAAGGAEGPSHAASAPAVTPIRAAADGTPVVTRVKDTHRPLPEGPGRK